MPPFYGFREIIRFGPGTERHRTAFVAALLAPSRRDAGCSKHQGSTRKGTLLESVPPGVTTWTVPVVAPVGIAVVISELETTVNVAAVPLNVTLVVPLTILVDNIAMWE